MFKRATSQSLGSLRFISTPSMERGLDGSDEKFVEYFFAIYHCSPDESAGINDYREQLRQLHPSNAIPVGGYFVLDGEPAYLALAAYYQSLARCETLGEEMREYAAECLERISTAHRRSQSLPVPINLTEGQLSNDPRLEFLTCMAVGNGQIVLAASA